MDSELELDIGDYNSFLKHIGDIKGCVKNIDKETFYESIIEPYKNDLKNAKAVLVEFEVGREVSLFEINEFMTIIHDCCPSDTSLVFGTSDKYNISINIIVCKILISGISLINNKL